MPHVGFLQENAVSQLDESKQITFDQFESQPELYAPRLAPATEALLYSLLQLSEDRAAVPSDEITASQIGDPIRMIWLKATNDYFTKPSFSIHGWMGNLKHANLLRHRQGVWTSLRLEDDLGSGELDTFIVRSGQLIDLKNWGVYRLKKVKLEGVTVAAWAECMQINRYASLIENPAASLIQTDSKGNVTRTPWIDVLKGKDWKPGDPIPSPRVRKLTLEMVGRDLGRQNKPGMLKITDVPEIITVDVPRMPNDEVRRVYTSKLRQKRKAFADGHAEICRPEDVWLQGKEKYPARCAEWCPVRDICVAYQRELGEPHYLDDVNLAGPGE